MLGTFCASPSCNLVGIVNPYNHQVSVTKIGHLAIIAYLAKIGYLAKTCHFDKIGHFTKIGHLAKIGHLIKNIIY